MMKGDGLAVFRTLLAQGKIPRVSNPIRSMNSKVTNSTVAHNPKRIFSDRVIPPHHCQNSPFLGIEDNLARADFIHLVY